MMMAHLRLYWYGPDNYHVSNYGVYFICKQFLETSGLISKIQ